MEFRQACVQERQRIERGFSVRAGGIEYLEHQELDNQHSQLYTEWQGDEFPDIFSCRGQWQKGSDQVEIRAWLEGGRHKGIV